MHAEQERLLDKYDVMATKTMWNRAAYHARRLKKSQLFKRPSSVSEMNAKQKSIDEMRRETDELNAWLANLTIERKEG